MRIPLVGKNAKGRVALVDDADYELVSGQRWRVLVTRRPNGNIKGEYAQAIGGAWQLMHRLIVDYPLVDHRNGDGLDNQRSNLRSASYTQNNANKRPKRGGTSKYMGVSRDRCRNKWQVHLQHGGNRWHLGRFDSEEDAALAYDKAAGEIHGEFARLNFPSGGY